MNRMLRNIAAFVLVSLIVSGCGPGQLFGPPISPTPTITITPTPINTHTPTLLPTVTSTTTPPPDLWSTQSLPDGQMQEWDGTDWKTIEMPQGLVPEISQNLKVEIVDGKPVLSMTLGGLQTPDGNHTVKIAERENGDWVLSKGSFDLSVSQETIDNDLVIPAGYFFERWGGSSITSLLGANCVDSIHFDGSSTENTKFTFVTFNRDPSGNPRFLKFTPTQIKFLDEISNFRWNAKFQDQMRVADVARLLDLVNFNISSNRDSTQTRTYFYFYYFDRYKAMNDPDRYCNDAASAGSAGDTLVLLRLKDYCLASLNGPLGSENSSRSLYRESLFYPQINTSGVTFDWWNTGNGGLQYPSNKNFPVEYWSAVALSRNK